MKGDYVAMEKNVCPICGKVFDTGAILLHKHLREIKQPAVTGRGLCPEHQRLFNEGFIAMVGVDESRCPKGEKLKEEEAYRTGRIMHIKREAAARIFDVSLPDMLSFCFVSDEVIDMVSAMVQGDNHETQS